MTYREYAEKNYPELLNEFCGSGVTGCPIKFARDSAEAAKINELCDTGNSCVECWNRTMPGTEEKKCSCYVEYETNGFLNGRCNGTREQDLCSCGGDESRCDFYPEKRGEILETPELPVYKLTYNISAKIDKNVDALITKTISDAVDGHIYGEILINKNKVVEAFDKYLAKRVLRKDVAAGDSKYPILYVGCPSCHKSLTGHENYCPDCGQHLDWRADE